MAEPKLSEAQKETLKNYLENIKILIADSSSTVRRSLSKALVGMGAKPFNISSMGDYPSAAEQIKKEKPQVVITDYFLTDGCGLHLAPIHREIYDDERQRMFIIQTSNSAETSVAEAAEEDCDGYILKPFSGDSLIGYLVDAITKKVTPNPYKEKLRIGKEQLRDQKFDQAVVTFEEARELTTSPTLALYYQGQAHEGLKNWVAARESYSSGLSHNEIHYKCLVGLVDVLNREKDFHTAYGYLTKLISHFPVSPTRLMTVFHLAVEVGDFDSLGGFYQSFIDLPFKSESLIRVVAAALLVGGKFFLGQDRREEALAVINRAIVTSARNKNVVLNSVLTVARFQLGSEALQLAQKFQPQDQQSDESYIARYAAETCQDTSEAAFEKGRALISKGNQHYAVFRAMIDKALVKADRRLAESLVVEAKRKHPSKEKEFDEMLGAKAD